MPKIPTADGPTVDQRPVGTPYLNERYDASQMGGQVANALGNVGQAAQHMTDQGLAIYKDARDKADTAATMEAEAKLKSGVTDAVTKFSELQGKDALEQSGQVYEGLTKLQTELAGGLNERQRKVFSLRASGVMDGARSGIEHHTGAQAKFLQEQSFKSLQSATANAVAVAAFDPDTRQNQIDSMEGPIRADAKRQGLPPEVAIQRIAEWKSQAAQIVLNKFIASGDGQGAMDYYAQVKDTLGEAGGKYLHEIRTVATEQQAGSAASAAVLSSVNKATGLPDEGKALAAWDKLPEGPVKKAAFEHLKQRLAVSEQIHTQQNQALYDAALFQYQKGKSLSQVDPAVRAKLDNPDNPKGPEMWQHLVALEQADRRASKVSGNEEKSRQRQIDTDAVNYFKSLPDDDKTKIDLANDPHFKDVSQGVLNTIPGLKKGAQNRVDRGEAITPGAFHTQVISTATDLQYDPQVKTAFVASLNDWYIQYRATHSNQEPGAKEVNARMAEMLLVGKSKDSWFNHTKWQMTPEDQKTFKPASAEDQVYQPNKELKPAKIVVVGPKGKVAQIAAETADAWLKANPAWSKR